MPESESTPHAKVASGKSGVCETCGIPEAVERWLAQFDDQHDQLAAGAREAVAWSTWAELAGVVRRAAAHLDVPDQSVAASVRRMADAVDRAIAWHS